MTKEGLWTGVSGTHLSHVVEVSMGHNFLCLQLLVFIEHLVEVEPRLQIAQSPECVGLPVVPHTQGEREREGERGRERERVYKILTTTKFIKLMLIAMNLKVPVEF